MNGNNKTERADTQRVVDSVADWCKS